MLQFLVKRFIGLLFVLLGVTFITFLMGYFAPGDPIRTLLGSHFNPVVYAQLKHEYGLDLPWYQQYWNYITHLARFDLGLSFRDQDRPVWDILKDGVPTTLELGLWALFLQVVIGVPVGIISALKANSWIDSVNMGTMLILFALPSFVLAAFVQIIIVWLDTNAGFGWPVAGWGNGAWQYSWPDIQAKLLPIFVLTAAGLAYFARISRTSMLEVLRQDYVRTARAKGMRERVVIYRHALRNAMIPLVTVFGFSLGLIITGTFFVEQIFNVPGIAQATITSIADRDYPVIQATVILLAFTIVMGNLISDILYAVVDPRIKIQ
jgi:ABC-type dipeptide/oligopeptide/nickel transport system permease component